MDSANSAKRNAIQESTQSAERKQTISEQTGGQIRDFEAAFGGTEPKEPDLTLANKAGSKANDLVEMVVRLGSPNEDPEPTMTDTIGDNINEGKKAGGLLTNSEEPDPTRMEMISDKIKEIKEAIGRPKPALPEPTLTDKTWVPFDDLVGKDAIFGSELLVESEPTLADKVDDSNRDVGQSESEEPKPTATDILAETLLAEAINEGFR
jgi:hypothetical protein